MFLSHAKGSRLMIIGLLLGWFLGGSNLRGADPETSEAQIKELKAKAWNLRSLAPDSAFLYAHQALDLARSTQNTHQQSSCLYILTVLNFNSENYILALRTANENLNLCRQIDFQPGEANALDILGTIHLNLGNHLSALDFYLQELALLETNEELQKHIGSVYINLGSLYEVMELNPRALEYQQKAELFFAKQAQPDSNQLAILALNQANVALKMDNFDAAGNYMSLACSYFSQQENLHMLAKCANNEGLIALGQNRSSDALHAFREALNHLLETEEGHIEDQIRFLINLSQAYEQLNQKSASYRSAQEAYRLARDVASPAVMLEVHGRMKDFFARYGEADSALFHFQIADSLNQILFDQERENMLIIADFESEASKSKERLARTLIELGASEMQAKMLSVGLGILLLVLILIGWSFYQFRSRKKAQIELMAEREKNQAQLLQGMIQEQELKSISFIIEGQEKEKKRISEELHDGLGGTLAAVRISLDQFRRQLKDLPSQMLEDFDYALRLLREGTEDVRRISHDMGAVRLKHGGLVPALQDMCLNLARHQSFVAKMETEGLEMLRINSEIEFHLYRIAQELFQNVIKHAQASQIKLQLTNAGGRLHLYMWDDGKGFDPAKVSGGMGMENLRLRTQQLNGKLHIDSAPGKGTYTHISIPV
jgi:two-component system NarL family sensor kinase